MTGNKLLPLLAAFVLCLAVFHPAAPAQSVHTASGPGSYVSLGFTASGYQQDYGKRYIGGATLFIDANLYRRIGIEAEGRRLAAHTSEDVKESTYLIGPKVSVLKHNLRPYGKFLVGRGTFDYPFHYAQGHYFVMAPGGGLDWHVGDRFNVRVADFEYQIWPDFTFGALHPYGLSAGLSVDIFKPSGRIRGRHF